jgi:hypothetical protein
LTGRRTFFVVFKGAREPTFTLYHDEPPSPIMLRTLPPVLYRYEITGTPWANASLTEIIDEYKRRVAAGTVPPDNTVKPPEAKPKTTIGRPARPWRTGDLALQK